MTVGTSTYPVRKLVVVGGNIWCATSNTIKILNSVSREIEDMITVGNDETKTIIAIVESGLGVWIAQQGSASLRLLHANSYITLAEVSCTNVVSKMLTNCDEIIRQHKTACLRQSCNEDSSKIFIATLSLTAITEVTLKQAVLCCRIISSQFVNIFETTFVHETSARVM